VVEASEPEAVEHLHLVAPGDVETAVAPGLSAGLGHPRKTEFQMEGEVGELVEGQRPLDEEPVLELRVLPMLRRRLLRAVEEDDGTLGSLRAQRRAFALDTVEDDVQIRVARAADADRAVLQHAA